MKTTIKEEVRKIRNFAKNMPKTINETLAFEADDMMDDEIEDMEEPQQQPQQDASMDVAGFVDDIRKKSLKGMASLADKPESQEYQLLKKIWQICDKKPEQEAGEMMPKQQARQM